MANLFYFIILFEKQYWIWSSQLLLGQVEVSS